MPFSFLNAAFLAGLAAAAVPILIHLFSRRKQTRVPFSSLLFIEEIAKRRVKRVKVTQWLILLLRVLVITLVALALGRPALRGDYALGKSRGESAVAVIFDRSFSMQAVTERGMLYQDARARALEVAEALEDGDEIHLVGTTPGLESKAPPFHDRLGLKNELQVLEPGWGATDLVEAIRDAGSRLRKSEALNRELFIISDFQRSGLGEYAESPGGYLADLVGEDTRIYLLPVSDGPVDNAAIEQVVIDGLGPDRSARVRVANHSTRPAEAITINVSMGGKTVGESPVTIEPNSANNAIVPLLDESADVTAGQVRLSGDRLAADDTRYFAAEGGRAFRILVVEGARAGEELTPFVSLALSPGAGVGQFDTTVETAPNIGAVDLVPFQVVFLNNVERLNRETLGRLKSWQDAGGRVMVALGDRVDLRHYNEELLPALLPGIRLIETRGDLRSASTFFTLTPRVAGHAAFAGFRATPGEPLSGAQFWRVVASDVGDRGRILAEFGTSLPALVETDGGALFCSSFDARWNNFCTHGAFLPLLHQLVYHLGGRETKGSALVGQPLEHVVEESAVPTGATLIAEGPDNVVLGVASAKTSQGFVLTSDAVPAPGLYKLKAGSTVLAELPVNVDTRESNLASIPDAELAGLFPGRQVRLLKKNDSVDELVRQARYGREFWREFLVAALALLALEGWLSRKGGA